MTVQKHKLSENELSAIAEASEKTKSALKDAITDFVCHLLVKDVSQTLAASALVHYVAYNVFEAMCVLYGMNRDDVNANEDALDTLALRLQRHIVVAVSEFVRTHMDENDLYVAPDDRKQNDAAEKAEYEYDRDKEERIDNSRN